MQSCGDRFRGALTATTGVPFTEGNTVTVLENGKEIFPAMLSEIEAAECTIDFLDLRVWCR